MAFVYARGAKEVREHLFVGEGFEAEGRGGGLQHSASRSTLPRGRKSSEASSCTAAGDRYHRAALKRIVQPVLIDNFRAEEGHQLADMSQSLP